MSAFESMRGYHSKLYTHRKRVFLLSHHHIIVPLLSVFYPIRRCGSNF